MFTTKRKGFLYILLLMSVIWSLNCGEETPGKRQVSEKAPQQQDQEQTPSRTKETTHDAREIVFDKEELSAEIAEPIHEEKPKREAKNLEPKFEQVTEPQHLRDAGPEPHKPDSKPPADALPPEQAVQDKIACTQAGHSPKGSQLCCKGLKKVKRQNLPNCKDAGEFICVRCGDGRCDSKTGENQCNCSLDCKPKPECTKNSDCGQTTCQQSSNDCIQSTPRCENNKCTKHTQSYGFRTCSQGTCKERKCTKASDCGVKACKQQGSTCQSIFPSCRQGKCSSSTRNYQNKNCFASTGSCSSSVCKKNGDCGKTTCKQSGSTCSQLTPVCNSGKCGTRSTTHSQWNCDLASGTCKKPGCTTSSQCGKKSCKQQGTTCVSTSHVCRSGSCSTRTRNYSNYQCSNGTCTKKAACKTNADCPKSCSNSGNDCIQNTPRCSSGTCVSSTTRKTRSKCGSSRICQVSSCRQSSDCGKPTCKTTGSSCTETENRCVSGRCQPKSTTHSSAKCHTTGLCVSNNGGCIRSSECWRLARCRHSGSSCVITVATCRSRRCTTKTYTHRNSVCSLGGKGCKARR